MAGPDRTGRLDGYPESSRPDGLCGQCRHDGRQFVSACPSLVAPSDAARAGKQGSAGPSLGRQVPAFGRGPRRAAVLLSQVTYR